ncbi:MAG: Xaa-Pro peptidase family protein [Candidatus Adiutrix sp.]|jgi:Xaa-Pro aminopeptidase|nr:Xaa-Pro peptidase family protein [Candidatus Adiutrix sp.]
MKPHLAQRIQTLQKHMCEQQLDAVVFTDRENLIYYTGAVEIECMAAVIPASGDPALCCLWLDAPYVKEQSGAALIKPYRFPAANIGQSIVEALKELAPEKPAVGFHKYFVEFSVFDALRQAIPGLEWRSATDITYRTRAVKSPEELALMRQACVCLEAGMRAAVDFARPGVTESAVLAEADYAMRKAGSEGASFRQQVLSWPKQLLAHPFAGNTVLENNQPVVIHLGASYQGYVAKMCRTVFLGNVPAAPRAVYSLLHEALTAGMEALRPGTTSAAVYNAIYAVVEKAGYGAAFLDHAGYGVGIRQSEFYPIIGRGLAHEIQENMVVDLLLPTIYQPHVGGPRLTDIIQVTRDGGKFMTNFTHSLILK